VQAGRWRLDGRKLPLELQASPLELVEFVFQPRGGLSVGQCIDEPIDLAADALALVPHPRRGLGLQPVPLGGEFLREDFEQRRVHEPTAQAIHDRRVKRVAGRRSLAQSRLPPR
jgi:hypothetical protein